MCVYVCVRVCARVRTADGCVLAAALGSGVHDLVGALASGSPVAADLMVTCVGRRLGGGELLLHMAIPACT